MTYNEFRFEVDLLQGNINRMCVTNDKKELSDMRDWAKRRIDKIFDYQQNQITGKETQIPPAPIVTLTTSQAHAVQMYILMTTQYRQGEIVTFSELAREMNEGGNPRYPNAASNAEWWKKADAELNGIAERISGIMTGRVKDEPSEEQEDAELE